MKLSLLILSLCVSSIVLAAQGLVINTSEFGVGKFHRYDNKVHPYDHTNAWFNYILADNAATDEALTVSNEDGSVTVFFSTLDDMIAAVMKVSADRGQKVSVLNVHGHGLPGAMWFPKDAATLNSHSCSDWRDAADGADQANYDQYYSPVSASEVMQIRAMSASANVRSSCTTGLREWQGALAKAPQFKSVFANDAQLHFLSCVVGLGNAGENFTKGIAALLLADGSQGRIETSTNFGLGDWSMPEGMGFWDYLTLTQLNHDNDIYGVDRKDREVMQKGTIRMVSFADGKWNSNLLAGRDFMSLGFESQIVGTPVSEVQTITEFNMNEKTGKLPARVRIPGTAAYAKVLSDQN